MNRKKIAACLLTLIVGTGVTTYVHAQAANLLAGPAKDLALLACDQIKGTDFLARLGKAICV